MNVESGSTLRHYLMALRRRKWVALIGFVIPIGIAIVLTLTATKMYQGSASVVIGRQSLADQVTNTADPLASTSDFLTIVQTYADSARSTQLAAQVIGAVPEAHLTAHDFLSMSGVSPSQDADILEFTAQNQNERIANQLATAYASQFVTYQQRQSQTSFNAALAQITERLGQARAGANKALIANLQSRAQELRTLEALQTSNNFVFNSATNASVVSPKKGTNIALGVIAGIVFAALFAGLFETFDTRVRSTEEVQASLQLPMLAQIGPPPKGFDERVISLTEPANAQTEGFRVLRTNLELQALRDHAAVFMVSSSVELEGKSLTIANLAVLAARAGRRVILVDLDLRRPTQDLIFGFTGRSPGITNVLLGRVSLDDALTEISLRDEDDDPVRAGSLQLLRSGILPPDPGELVASEQLKGLIETLRARADLVFIDTPPVLRAGDALSISRLCDAVFLIARLPKVTRSMLNELARMVSACPVPVVGFVATGVQSSVEYGYGYGSSGTQPNGSGREASSTTTGA